MIICDFCNSDVTNKLNGNGNPAYIHYEKTVICADCLYKAEMLPVAVADLLKRYELPYECVKSVKQFLPEKKTVAS